MRVRRGDRGQVLPLVALVLAFALGLGLVLVRVASDATARAQAEHAADAAALAGAVGDRTAAAEVARANGATLEAFTRAGDVVEVTVSRRGRRATARAEAVVSIT